VRVWSKETPESLVAVPSCAAEMPGAEQGGCNWPVRSIKRSLQRRQMPPPCWVDQREPSRFRDGEGHGRHLGFGSGCRGTLRRKGTWNGQTVVLGTGEALLGLVAAGDEKRAVL